MPISAIRLSELRVPVAEVGPADRPAEMPSCSTDHIGEQSERA
ncbi:hypothetical protein ACH4KO_10055 [Streptomyces anulatus]